METKLFTVRLKNNEISAVKFLRIRKIAFAKIVRYGVIQTIKAWEEANPLDKFSSVNSERS